MAAWPTDAQYPVSLAPGSIAGCWSTDAANPGVYLTTKDGLVYQSLTRDEATKSWKASPPVRILREPFVPRATTNPERPYILIGPGPKDQPHMLQIVAMKPVE